MAVIAFGGISSSLKDLLASVDWSPYFTAANRITQVRVYQEAIVAELSINNMPLLNVREDTADLQLVNIPRGYYFKYRMEVDVYAFDFTKLSEATTLRDSLLAEAIKTVASNQRFHVDLETSVVGPDIKLGALQVQNGGHVALATFPVVAEGYNEP